MRFSASEADAKRASEFLFQQLDPDQAAVSAFEGDGTWIVEVHFREAPDRAGLTSLARDACDGTTPDISFDRVAVTDWVASSLAGLTPVRVGRFVVHGAHDRGKFSPNGGASKLLRWLKRQRRRSRAVKAENSGRKKTPKRSPTRSRRAFVAESPLNVPPRRVNGVSPRSAG
jgi:hypothetical protein